MAPRQIGRRSFDLERQVAVMAIVNRTRDSFYDQGRTFALDAAVDAALAAAEAGADWVDIGGVPFSPDAEQVSAAEEIERLVPVVERVTSASDVVVSVDTTRAAVAAACLAAGASVVNDTSGLYDPAMAPLVAETGATLVLTHSLAAPGVHHPRPAYADVVAEVRDRLVALHETARAAGVRDDQVVVDPGPDLNKNTRHTLELCRRFDEFAALGPPTLVAVSNKDFVGETLDRAKPDRLVGSAVAAAWCVQRGGRILRVHDVAGGVDTARMCEAIMGWREPAYERHNV
ncbi:dihydropteroate synthase [Mariniluteicoccus endophyticus]